MSDKKTSEEIDFKTELALTHLKYDQLDRRLTAVECKIDDLHTDIRDGHTSLTKVIVGAAGTIVAGLLSTIVVILMNV